MPRFDEPTLTLDSTEPNNRGELEATITETISHQGMGEIHRETDGTMVHADVWERDDVQQHVDETGTLWWRQLDEDTTRDLFAEMGDDTLVVTGNEYEPKRTRA